MSRTLVVSNLAEHDLKQAFAWSQKHFPADGERFTNEVRDTLEMLRETPMRWAVWHRGRLRRCVLPRLPYSIYYRVDESSVFIEAFLHHRLDATARFSEDP